MCIRDSHEIEYTKTQILNSAVVGKIAEIQRLTEELMMAAGNSIKDCREIERFLNKYMPATTKFIDAYHPVSYTHLDVYQRQI